jgi:hypothetical protein
MRAPIGNSSQRTATVSAARGLDAPTNRLSGGGRRSRGRRTHDRSGDYVSAVKERCELRNARHISAKANSFASISNLTWEGFA